MGIQTDLPRIINAKAAIKAAIEGKGVTVPDGTLLDGMAALIASIEAGGGNSIWGGKFTTGSFVLAEETTSTYTIATSKDEAMTGLLYDGETITNSNVYNSIGLLVVRKPTDSFNGSDYSACLIGTVFFPTYYGGGAAYVSSCIYLDTYGTVRAKKGGANVTYNALSVEFETSAKGSPDFEYMWLAWRHLK